MAKILKNNTAFDILVSDTGANILASSSYTIPLIDYPLWAQSSDVVTFIGSGDITVNDGSYDLSKAEGIGLIQGSFIRKVVDFEPSLKDNNKLKVMINQISPNDFLSKVSLNDQVGDYLENKIIGTANKIEVSVLNDGIDEDLQINIGNDVFDKSINTTDNITEGTTNLFFTNERAQDAVGNSLTDSSNIDLVYNDAANTISADLINTGVTAGSYGSATQVSTITVDSKGRLSSASNTTISIPSTQVNDFVEAAQDAVGNILTDTSSVDFTYNDASNTISAAVLPAGVNHAQLNNLNSATHYHLTQTEYTDLTDAGDLALHFHSSDRNRANHTGTQLSKTIS